MLNDIEEVSPLAKGIIAIVGGSTLTAVMRPKNTFWATMRNWLGGMIAGVLAMLLTSGRPGLDSNFRLIMVAGSAAFIASIYPLAAAAAQKWFKTKSDGSVPV